MNRNIVRQGDLLFIQMGRPRRGPGDTRTTDGILAKGEATGHHHRVADVGAAEIYPLSNGDVEIHVGPKGVSIVHEEHATVFLEPNAVYEMHRAREFDYLAQLARRVMD